MSLVDLRDDVFGLCQELQDQFDFNPGHVDRYINRGYKAFVRDTSCIEDIIDITTVANQFEYTKADNSKIGYIYHINHVRHIDSSSPIGHPLTILPGGYGGLPRTYRYGRPHYYWTRGMMSADGSANNAKAIGLWPVDSTAGNTIRLYVSRHPLTDLSNDGDEPEIPEAWHEALIFYAAMMFFRKYGHLKPQWRRKYLELKAEYQELVNIYIEKSSVEYGELTTIFEED